MMNEYAILYLEINIFSLVLIGIILLKTRGLSQMVAQSNFAMSIIAEMVFFVSDTLFVLVNEGVLPGGKPVMMACKEVYFLATAAMCFFWFIYFEYLRETRFVKRRRYVLYSTSILWLMVIALLANLFNHSLFYIDESGVYRRGPFFILTYILSYSYVLIAFIRVMINLKRDTEATNKDLLIRLAFFPLFPGISGVLQFIYPRLPIACATISITTLYLYLTWVDQLISLDPLTGLNNRKQLTHTFNNLSKSHEDQDKIRLYLIDVNHFKQINDTYGHLQGDNALKIIAEALKAACKGANRGTVIARYGGDEFVILVSENNNDETIDLKERIKEKLKEFSKKKSVPFELTVSVGSACSDNGDSLKDLILKADKAMYMEKKKYH
ncbi:diguanylate cyclase (GGDEF) domain-containing protein [Oribacterium sp. KHPX15]|uniref:GGDEF domain-containing protein n=1 Tax=Oribacterium sp. KHPX15 TaxID=1855342 RepID=UPI00089A6360|nr:GGDEF domain-containing protein [Oribacterium sp. KHPX15]SEA61428.1 diguanylate cyclase (GGDEF) domain-containing protein [Oribacterium sp. KHPX15]